MEDVELVSAITFCLSYFYNKAKNQNGPIRIWKKTPKRRRFWMTNMHKNRIRGFMEDKFYELLNEPSGQFDNFCSMSFADFQYILDRIAPMISKKDTDFRHAIPAKYRLAIALRYLASGDSYNTIHNIFKVSIQSISKIIPEVCRAINEVLKDEIQLPSSSEDWLVLENGFARHFPHCLGCLDAKHVILESPPNRSNSKKIANCIVLITLIDSNYNFMYMDIGCQYGITDGTVFNNSLLWQKICKSEINFPAPCPLPDEVNMPYVFLADDSFNLSTHVMTSYPGQHEIGSSKGIFNDNFNRSRLAVENTFGLLTSVFRFFQRPINLHPNVVMEITKTCILLHNFLRHSKSSCDNYTPPGVFDSYDDNGRLLESGTWRNDISGYNAIQNLPDLSHSGPSNGSQVRDDFTSYFTGKTNCNVSITC